MSLVFKRRNACGEQESKWRSVLYDASQDRLVWTDSPAALAGSELNVPLPSLREQVATLLSYYTVFSYLDNALEDKRPFATGFTHAEKLNLIQMRPDFTLETLERGWISPEGAFVGCAYGNHASLYEQTLGKTRGDKAGWIMIQPDFFRVCCKETPITDVQTECLRKLGFENISAPHNRTTIPDFNSDLCFAYARTLALAHHANSVRPFVVPEKQAFDLLTRAADSAVASQHTEQTHLQSTAREPSPYAGSHGLTQWLMGGPRTA